MGSAHMASVAGSPSSAGRVNATPIDDGPDAPSTTYVYAVPFPIVTGVPSRSAFPVGAVFVSEVHAASAASMHRMSDLEGVRSCNMPILHQECPIRRR